MPKIFISHTHADKEIADAINQAVESLFGKDTVQVVYSTKKGGEAGIPHGEDWFDWIVAQVSGADVALVLLTPGSIQKPWLLWEAGAVEGVALAGQASGGQAAAVPGEKRPRKVRPLLFHLRSSDIPSPFHRLQMINGDKQEDVEPFLLDLIDQFQGTLKPARLVEAGTRLESTVKTYIESASKALLRAPLLVSEAAVQEWLVRLDGYEKRPSEIEQLHDWLKVAFGRGDEEQDRPLDLRIHRRLGELYAKSGTLESRRRAAREMELARQLAPRDIFVLRQLGSAYISTEEYEKAWKIIEEIGLLDPKAFERSAECAALRGKWLRARNNPRDAAKVYADALTHDPDSYYLANLAAEASLEAMESDRAKDYYKQVLDIIQRINEKNIWTWASAANACLAQPDVEGAKRYAGLIFGERPSRQELDTIERGLRVVQSMLGLPVGDVEAVMDALRGRDTR